MKFILKKIGKMENNNGENTVDIDHEGHEGTSYRRELQSTIEQYPVILVVQKISN